MSEAFLPDMIYGSKVLQPVPFIERFERRGLRWWWVFENKYVRAELGPFWLKRSAIKARARFPS